MIILMKAKKTCYCTICGAGMVRTVHTNAENTPAGIKQGKAEISKKLEKPYTCRICASVVKAQKS